MVAPAIAALCRHRRYENETRSLRRDRPLELVSLETYASRERAGSRALIGDSSPASRGRSTRSASAVAGPVTATQVETTNLPWLIDANELSAGSAGCPCFLLNDLEALAYGVPVLREDACVVLNPGLADPTGTVAVIAAGTGLGEGGLLWAAGATWRSRARAATPTSRPGRRARWRCSATFSAAGRT